jgi:hypothetical protein
MAHGDAREGKWRGNWRMEWVSSTLHTTSEHGVSSTTTADAHTSAASCRLNWRPCQFKWTRPFRRKTESGFCACAITFQTQSTLLTESITSDASCRHFLCLVFTKAEAEEHLSLSYFDPKNNKAVCCSLSKGRIIRAQFTQKFRKGLPLENGMKLAVSLLCSPVEFWPHFS